MTAQHAKAAAAHAVCSEIESGMTLGLGTGSTAAIAIEALGVRIQQEGLQIRGVATSFAAERLARAAGITLVDLEVAPRLDLAFDGADEVDPMLNLIKGRGAAQTREKIVANAADRFIVLIDESKQVARLGQQMPVPVEVVPMAVGPVSNLLRSCGAEPNLRMGAKKDGPVVTDQGLWIIDATFESGIEDADTVAQKITHEPGVLEHGLFIGLATEVLVGKLDGTVSRQLRPVP